MTDNVNHPKHYVGFSNGAEVLDITENLSFNLGNVVKYVARAGRKTEDPLEDLQKAQFYLKREIDRISDQELLPLPPPGLGYIEGVLWLDSEGDEWKYEDGVWYYRVPDGLWWDVKGPPGKNYGPFREKRG